MDYRLVGKTGQKISTLSYGCMRFVSEEAAVSAIRKAVELGVNYFDVAPLYGSGTAEPWMGAGLKGLTEKVIVTAKSSPGNGGEGAGIDFSPETGFGITTVERTRKMIERSMELIGVDHLDMYHLWAVHGDAVFVEAIRPGGFLEGVKQAQTDGLFDYIGITSHMDSDGIIRCLSQFDFDMLTVPFHLLDTSRWKAVEYCKERGIGVLAMNPLAGGGLARESSVLQKIADDLGFQNMAEAALRFVISYPGITSALNGITYEEHAEASVKAVEKGCISKEVAEQLQARVSELYRNVQHFCTGCGYCGECPEGIMIPKTLEVFTNMLVPSLADAALADLVDRLAVDPTSYDPSLCAACKACESKCPNHLPVSELMAAAVEKWPK